jgi:hypothetical protein
MTCWLLHTAAGTVRHQGRGWPSLAYGWASALAWPALVDCVSPDARSGGERMWAELARQRVRPLLALLNTQHRAARVRVGEFLLRCGLHALVLDYVERLDGSLAVIYQGKTIASKEAPPNPVTLRARKRAQATTPLQDLEGMQSTPSNGHSEARATLGRGHLLLPKKTVTKPGPNHPWRRPVLTKSLNT